MGKKKNPGSTVGRSIIKDRFGHGKLPKSGDSFLHTSELNDGFEWGRLNLQSVTEQSNLDDFLSTAELAGTEFTAEKLNVKFVDPRRHVSMSDKVKQDIDEAQSKHKCLLRIPRRPDWDESTTAEQLELKEREAFMEWRKGLAMLQEEDHIVMTPYEKNLDFWRQLWRVIERSDIVVQIVDARNPLLFRCDDVETYVHELDDSKVNLLLVNKADYLTIEQRAFWCDYFTSKDIRVVFWSALDEARRLKEQEQEEVEKESNLDDMECDDDSEPDHAETHSEETADSRLDDSLDNNADSLKEDIPSRPCAENEENSGKGDNSIRSHVVNSNSAEILRGPELLEVLKTLHTGKKYKEGVTTVGMIGYPNVGKSSTINAILQMKKVPVSATPGRTKHFQTLFVEPTLMLCDCPGLVFPSFVTTKAELVVNGVLPIDQMRDHIPPVSLVCDRIPRGTLESTYSLHIPLPENCEDNVDDIQLTADELLNAYGLMRGYMTSNGLPDCPRSARYILKDYVFGKLLYSCPPPGTDAVVFNPAPPQPAPTDQQPGEQYQLMPKAPPTTSLDKAFFSKNQHSAHTKGTHGVSGFVRTQGIRQVSVASTASTLQDSQGSLDGKSWKRHNNKHKKEKLRRIHSEMDQQ